MVGAGRTGAESWLLVRAVDPRWDAVRREAAARIGAVDEAFVGLFGHARAAELAPVARLFADLPLAGGGMTEQEVQDWLDEARRVLPGLIRI